MALVFDVLFLTTRNSYWAGVSYPMIAAGILSGFLAAPFGFIDWLAIPSGTRAKRVGALHGAGNLVVIVLYAMSWAQRGLDAAAPPLTAFIFSFAGGCIALFTGWLGGELVDRLGVGVDEGANVNAPSSLRKRRVTS